MFGVPAALEPWEDAKLAGWKRGREGKRKLAAVPEGCRTCDRGGRRRAWEGMLRESILGEKGELGMFRSGRDDMWRSVKIC